MSHFQHVHESYRHVMALGERERVDFLETQRWIGYPVAARILERLERLLRQPKRTRMQSLLVVGESNNGKTTLIERFLETAGQPSVDDNNDPVKPVLLVESPPSADEKGLYLSILDRFHAPHRASDPVSKLRYQVLHLCRACHVRMLVVDEFHSLVSGTGSKQREVMNVIKFLCNELAVPIVGAGTREAVRALHHDPQHASRFDVMELPLWTLDKDFQRMLASIEKTLPLKNPSKLSQPALARPLHYISQGNLGNLLRLLNECSTEAIESGTEAIDQKIIENNKWVRPTAGIRERIG